VTSSTGRTNQNPTQLLNVNKGTPWSRPQQPCTACIPLPPLLFIFLQSLCLFLINSVNRSKHHLFHLVSVYCFQCARRVSSYKANHLVCAHPPGLHSARASFDQHRIPLSCILPSTFSAHTTMPNLKNSPKAPRRAKKRGNKLQIPWLYDIVLWALSVLIDLFFREVHPRGAWKVPRTGPIILVAAPHANQVR